MGELDGRRLLDALPPGIVLVDESGSPTLANRGFAHMLGVEPEQLTPARIGAALFEPATGAMPDVLAVAVDKALAGEPARAEHVTVVTDRGMLGRIVWAVPFDAGGDRPTQALLLFPIEEERLHILLENTSDVITVLDADGTIRYSNPAAGSLMTFEPGTVLAGTSGFDLIHPDDQERAIVAFQNRLTHPGASSPEELRVRFGDGSWHTMEISLSNLIDNPGIGGVVLTLHDITDRKAAEEELVRREQGFRSLVENLHDVIVVLDESATVTYASPAIEAIIGAPADTNIGMSAFNDVHPDDMALATSVFERVRANPDAVERMEIRLHHVVDDRWPWVEIVAVNRLHDPAVEGVVCTIRDITAVKQAELVKDEFLSTISHELRTPLTSIVGFTDVLRRETSLDEATRARLLERVSSNADQMSAMVEQILSFSRLEAGRAIVDLVPVDLGESVDTCVSELERQLDGYAVELEVAPGLRAMADRDALGHVLRNLVANAAKFAPPGSTVRVTATRLNGVVEVSVHDEGPGIEVEDQPRIFERFVQGARRPPGQRGTGLGLSVVRRYVELLGGRIWFESTPGQGAIFTFTLQAVPS